MPIGCDNPDKKPVFSHSGPDLPGNRPLRRNLDTPCVKFCIHVLDRWSRNSDQRNKKAAGTGLPVPAA